MSSGCTRCSVLAAPLPNGWKLCFSVVPKTICFTVSVLLEALALAELEPELGLELELEHPAVPSRPAAMTVAPSQVAVRRLKVFTKLFVGDPGDARYSGVERAGERPTARRGPNSKEQPTVQSRAGPWRTPEHGQAQCLRVWHVGRAERRC